MLLGRKMDSVKKLAKRVKSLGSNGFVEVTEPSKYECLLREHQFCSHNDDNGDEGSSSPPLAGTPTGYFAVYVGEERRRFVVPTGYLSHPLFKMLLEKAYNEYGFQQRCGLVVPCSLAVFQEVVNAVEGCNGRFDFGKLVDEFIN